MESESFCFQESFYHSPRPSKQQVYTVVKGLRVESMAFQVRVPCGRRTRKREGRKKQIRADEILTRSDKILTRFWRDSDEIWIEACVLPVFCLFTGFREVPRVPRVPEVLRSSIPVIKLDTLKGRRKGDPKHECCGKNQNLSASIYLVCHEGKHFPPRQLFALKSDAGYLENCQQWRSQKSAGALRATNPEKRGFE